MSELLVSTVADSAVMLMLIIPILLVSLHCAFRDVKWIWTASSTNGSGIQNVGVFPEPVAMIDTTSLRLEQL